MAIYNSVLNAWATSAATNAPSCAESLLGRMRTLAGTERNPSAEPDAVSVSTVVSCHTRIGTWAGAERGDELLGEAAAMYGEGNARVGPDAIMHNCAIQGDTFS